VRLCKDERRTTDGQPADREGGKGDLLRCRCSNDELVPVEGYSQTLIPSVIIAQYFLSILDDLPMTMSMAVDMKRSPPKKQAK
jgi:hypothetical protein